MKMKKIIYAYENSYGDKGIIIARSMKKAIELFKKEYPERNIIYDDKTQDYDDNGAYIYEVSDLKYKNRLYCLFEW